MEDRKFLFLYKVNVIMPKDRQNYIMKIYSIFSFYANHLLCFKCWWLITCGNVLDMGNLFLHSPNAEIGELVLFFCITLCQTANRCYLVLCWWANIFWWLLSACAECNTCPSNANTRWVWVLQDRCWRQNDLSHDSSGHPPMIADVAIFFLTSSGGLKD